MLVDEVLEIESLGQSGDGIGLDQTRGRDSGHDRLCRLINGHELRLHDPVGTVSIGAGFRQGELGRRLNWDNHSSGFAELN